MERQAWTLREALGRTSRRSTRAAVAESEAILRQGPPTEDWNDKFWDAHDRLHDEFRAAMSSGRASSAGHKVGKTGRPGATIPIEAEAWRFARIDWERSELSHGQGVERRTVTGVRVSPWLHLPDVPARLAGVPLNQAFRRFVLDDPEFVAAIDKASACHPGWLSCRCEEVADGRFSSSASLWPAMLEARDLAAEWMEAPDGSWAELAPDRRREALARLAKGSDYDRATLRIIRYAEAVVRDRVERFLAPLRAGELVAEAYPEGNAGTARILPSIWLRPTTMIDFMNGELFRASGSGPPRCEWTGIMLSLPEADSVDFDAPIEAPKSKGGRPSVYDWNGLVVALMERMQKEGEPTTGTHFIAMAEECFQAMRSAVPSERQIRRELQERMSAHWARAVSRT